MMRVDYVKSGGKKQKQPKLNVEQEPVSRRELTRRFGCRF
jgi:hypothetical protein